VGAGGAASATDAVALVAGDAMGALGAALGAADGTAEAAGDAVGAAPAFGVPLAASFGVFG
jgi:hypothetical protein